jgi:WD40 repeat protein
MRVLVIGFILNLTTSLFPQDILVGPGMKLTGHQEAVYEAAPIPNENKLLLTGDWSGELHLWDFEQKKSIGKKNVRGGFIRGLQVARKGGAFVVGTNQRITIGKLKPFDIKHEIEVEGPDNVFCSDVAISPDGTTVAAMMPALGVQFYSVNQGKLMGSVTLPSQCLSVCYLADGRLAVGGSKAQLEIIRGMQLDSPIQIAKSIGRIDDLIISPDGSHLAAMAHDEVKIIPVLSGASPIDLPGNKGTVAYIAWSHDSQALIASYDSGLVSFFTQKGQFVHEKQLPQGQASCVAMTSGGGWFISGGGTFIDMNQRPPRKSTGDNSLLVWPLTRKGFTASVQPDSDSGAAVPQALPDMSQDPDSAELAYDPKRWSAPMHAAAKAYQVILEDAMQQATVKEDFAFALKLKQERDLVANGQPIAPSANAPGNLRDARNLYIQHEQAFRQGAAKSAQ